MSANTDHKMRSHQRNLRGGRMSEALACFAITKCVAGRRKILNEKPVATIVMDSLAFLRNRNQIKLLAFCVMPDHYHALFVLLPDHSLSEVMKSFGKFTAREINKLMKDQGGFWQEGYFDHRCRDVDDMLDRMTYIERNPVRAKLVANEDEWPYSSAYAANAAMLDRRWYAEQS